MSSTVSRSTALASICLFLATACSDRDDNQLTYTYEKLGMTEQQMLSDQQNFDHTSGVAKVIPTFDKGRVVMELYVMEDNKIPGLEKAQELGYRQVQH